MKNKIARAVTYLLSFAICIWLFKLAYSGLDFASVWQYVSGMDLFWVCMVALSSFVCQSARSLRWQLLLKACGEQISFRRLFLSLMAGYFVHQALPRVGEIVRCWLVKKSDNVGYGVSIGTVVAERTIDTLCLAILVAGTILSVNAISYSFFNAHINLPLRDMAASLPLYTISVGFLLLAALLSVCYYYLNRRGYFTATRQNFAGKALGFGSNLLTGITAVLKLRQKWAFLLYTLIIWAMYFLMTYLWFFALPETSHLGVKEAFFIWAIGSIGRLVPVQGGGAGAYHYLVIQAFLLFGVSAGVAGAMALVIHGLQTAIYVIAGSISLVWYLLLLKKSKT